MIKATGEVTHRDRSTIGFHSFRIISRRRGWSMEVVGIGRDAHSTAQSLKDINFAGLDFERDFELRPVQSQEVSL